MSRKSKSVNKRPLIREETAQGIFAVIFFSIGLILTFASFGIAGKAGEKISIWLFSAVGIGSYLIPILSFLISFGFLKALRGLFPFKTTIGAFILFLSGLGIIGVAFPTEGGIVGKAIASPLVKLFDVYTTIVVLATIFIISALFIFDAALSLSPFFSLLNKIFKKKNHSEETTEESEKISMEENQDYNKENKEEADTETVKKIAEPADLEKKKIKGQNSSQDDEFKISPANNSVINYTPPPLSLLENDRGKPGVGDIKANANIIKRTLQNFGIEVEMDEISIGPSVTRYALKPAESVRLSKIVALQRELELALAAHPIRIEAPIPGKSLVGIEIPNTIKAVVGLATMLGNPEFTNSDKPLLVSLGKDLTGKAHFANLSKMPHLLIAGATGSGKSVTIHTIITSLLFHNSPSGLKLLLIDPKRVELTLYNKIPHLLTPVITDAKKAILTLKWAAKEMDRRYDILESESVRDIHSYHKHVKDSESTMPYIVIVIDELADIMSSYPRELEAAIVRLAQMSRAVGIHLILSTQRPSVNVITGLIKANVPARIALQVSSQIDSRTILDTGGAEKLLGAGDMLFLSGEMSKPARLQSAFISENEVKKVTAYLAREYKDEPPSELFIEGEVNSIAEGTLSQDTDSDLVDDNLYEDAREAILKAGRASTSYLQRKLRVGYARAARLMDMLEERNVIGPADGSKPRMVSSTGIEQEQINQEINPPITTEENKNE